MNTSVPATMLLRRITTADNAAIARVIRQVPTEYGLTADEDCTIADPNLDELYELYNQPGSAYWVVEKKGEVVGGGGIIPLAYSELDICELQKMYFMTSARGQGLTKKLALLVLDYVHEQGFKRCYLGTTAFLTEAIGLYEHLDFEHIDGPLGCTGHVDYEIRVLRVLQRLSIAGVPSSVTLTGATVRWPGQTQHKPGYILDGTPCTLPVLAVPSFCWVAANALPDLRSIPLRAEALSTISLLMATETADVSDYRGYGARVPRVTPLPAHRCESGTRPPA